MKHILTILCCLLLALPCNAETLQLDIEVDNSELQKILETALVLPPTLTSGDSLDQRWLKHFQRQLPKLVNSTLEPYGYFHSRTDSRLEQPSPEEYLLKIEVTPGEPLRITSLHLELVGDGAELPELQHLLNSFPLNEGDVLRQDHYEQGKTRLIQGAVDLGFLDANFQKHQIRVHRADRRADIVLRLASGIRYRFGQTKFTGASSYPERFLRRYLNYREGEIFSHRKLGQTQLNLHDSDLFRQISITPVTGQTTDDRVPVEIALQPAPRHRLRPGVGYGTDTGARGSLRYHNLNLLRRGHELQGELLLAEQQQSVVSTYIIPDLNRLDSRTQLRVGFDREETDTFMSRELFAEGEYQRGFGKNLVGSLFLRLTQEHSEIGIETTRSQMLLPGVRLQWRQVDNPVTPQYGLQGSIELKGTAKTLLSDTSLLQLTAQTTNLIPLPRKYSLLLRLQGGTTWHNDPLRDLPASLRFFAGGDRSVRGYRYQSLGPLDATGQVVGGKHLLVSNVELEKRVAAKWGGAIFYDIGNAFDSFAEYELEQGAGIGVRRYTRIGPLRIDLARQIGTDTGKWRVHFSMGFGW